MMFKQKEVLNEVRKSNLHLNDSVKDTQKIGCYKSWDKSYSHHNDNVRFKFTFIK